MTERKFRVGDIVRWINPERDEVDYTTVGVVLGYNADRDSVNVIFSWQERGNDDGYVTANRMGYPERCLMLDKELNHDRDTSHWF